MRHSELDQSVAPPAGVSENQLQDELHRLQKQLEDKDNDLKVLQEENKKQQEELTEYMLKLGDNDVLDRQVISV